MDIPSPRGPATANKVPSESVLSPRVVIVEDEAVVAEDLSHKVATLGYSVVGVFPTGEGAISGAEELTPELILLDLQLAGLLDGLQAAEQLHLVSDAAIVFVTAHSNAETVKRAIDTGPYGYILKPFTERDLAVQLDVALFKHRADRALRQAQEERRQTEEGLRMRSTQLQSLYELASAVNRADSLPSLYETAIEAIIFSLKANRASILTIDGHQIMRFQASRGLSESYRTAVDGHSPWKPEEVDPAPIMVSDVSAADIEPALRETILQEGIQSLAFIPLKYGGRLFGKFMVYFDTPHAMTPEEVEMARGIANTLAIGIDRKQAEGALRESEERLRLANMATNEAIWDWNVATDQVVWNQNVVTLFGWSEAADAPHPAAWWVERVHPEDRSRVVDHFFASVNDPMIVSWADDYRFQKCDGSYSHVSDRAFVVRDASGQPVRMLGTMSDITALKEAQDRLQDFAQDLERTVTVRTVELIETQDRLRALSTELSLAEHRQRKRLAIELHDHLQQLLVLAKIQVGQGKRYAVGVPGCESVMKKLDDVLSDALTYTRTLVADLSPPVLREHGLAAGLKWLAESMKKHDLLVSVTLPEDQTLDLPEETTVLLFQSIRELLINCSKHAGTGRATVSMTECNRELAIQVRDEGKGFNIAPAGSTDADSGVSSKFGLFAIRERMQAIGGSMVIRSSPGEGTTATLSVPIPAEYRQASKGTKMVLDVASHQRGALTIPQRISRSMQVVLVDDHTMVRQGLRSILESYSDVEIVGEAADGEEAVALVSRLQPQVVVMDINMPKKTGIEATAEIKSHHPEILVIGLSVSTGRDNEEAMLKAGAAALLNKESAVDHLYETVRRAVSIHHVLTPAAEALATITVLLVDGDKQDREYWAQRLKISSSEYVVLEADSGASALAICESQDVDCVVLEVGLPDMSGYQLLVNLVHSVSCPEMAVVMLSRTNLPSMAELALHNGAKCYLLKSHCSGEDLHVAIQKAIALVGPRKKRKPDNWNSRR